MYFKFNRFCFKYDGSVRVVSISIGLDCVSNGVGFVSNVMSSCKMLSISCGVDCVLDWVGSFSGRVDPILGRVSCISIRLSSLTSGWNFNNRIGWATSSGLNLTKQI